MTFVYVAGLVLPLGRALLIRQYGTTDITISEIKLLLIRCKYMNFLDLNKIIWHMLYKNKLEKQIISIP